MKVIIVSTLTVAAAGAAFAHGPQIQLTRDNDKVVTRGLFIEEPYRTTLSPEVKVYVVPLLPSTGGTGTEWYVRPNTAVNSGTGLPQYISGPGLAWGYGVDPGTGQTPWPTGSKFALTFDDGLKWWDGTSFVDPGATQLEAFRTGANAISAVSTDTAPFASVNNIGPVTVNPANLDPHASVRYRLLGNGTSSVSPVADGIYLAAWKIGMLDLPAGVSIADSDRFYFAMCKNVDLNDAAAVIRAQFPGAPVQIVPEPSAGILLLGGLLGLRRRR
jgi:hypothetical protein